MVRGDGKVAFDRGRGRTLACHGSHGKRHKQNGCSQPGRWRSACAPLSSSTACAGWACCIDYVRRGCSVGRRAYPAGCCLRQGLGSRTYRPARRAGASTPLLTGAMYRTSRMWVALDRPRDYAAHAPDGCHEQPLGQAAGRPPVRRAAVPMCLGRGFGGDLAAGADGAAVGAEYERGPDRAGRVHQRGQRRDSPCLGGVQARHAGSGSYQLRVVVRRCRLSGPVGLRGHRSGTARRRRGTVGGLGPPDGPPCGRAAAASLFRERRDRQALAGAHAGAVEPCCGQPAAPGSTAARRAL
jgi:hypothetical protein